MSIKLVVEIETDDAFEMADADDFVDCIEYAMDPEEPVGDEFWREALAGSDITAKVTSVRVRLAKEG